MWFVVVLQKALRRRRRTPASQLNPRRLLEQYQRKKTTDQRSTSIARVWFGHNNGWFLRLAGRLLVSGCRVSVVIRLHKTRRPRCI